MIFFHFSIACLKKIKWLNKFSVATNYRYNLCFMFYVLCQVIALIFDFVPKKKEKKKCFHIESKKGILNKNIRYQCAQTISVNRFEWLMVKWKKIFVCNFDPIFRDLSGLKSKLDSTFCDYFWTSWARSHKIFTNIHLLALCSASHKPFKNRCCLITAP